MNQQQGKLGIREYVAFAILMVSLRGTEDTPAQLYNIGLNAAWMIPLFSAAIFFIPLFLLLKTMKLYREKNLFTVIEKLMGKYIGFVVCLLIFIISSSGISFDTRTYANIIRAFYFKTTPLPITYALLLVVCAYGAKKGIQHIGTVSYLIVFYAVFSFCLAFLLSTQHSDIQAIFPIWGPGIVEIVKQSSQQLNLYADFFLFTLVIPYITTVKEFQKGTWIAFVSVSIQLSVAILLYVCLFDNYLGGIGYPFHTAIGFISLGSYIPNIELFFFIIWIMAACIRFTAFLYINALMFGHLFKIKDFEYLIPSLAATYLLIGIIPESPYDVYLEFRPIIAKITSAFFPAISIIIWLAALVKGEFKHAKNRNSM